MAEEHVLTDTPDNGRKLSMSFRVVDIFIPGTVRRNTDEIKLEAHPCTADVDSEDSEDCDCEDDCECHDSQDSHDSHDSHDSPDSHDSEDKDDYEEEDFKRDGDCEEEKVSGGVAPVVSSELPQISIESEHEDLEWSGWSGCDDSEHSDYEYDYE
jgi:hypothetical protein